jgi:hypothetical protein
MGVKTYSNDLNIQLMGQAQKGLDKEDYKVIKVMESYLVELGKLSPEFKEERYKLRTRINELREK